MINKHIAKLSKIQNKNDPLFKERQEAGVLSDSIDGLSSADEKGEPSKKASTEALEQDYFENEGSKRDEFGNIKSKSIQTSQIKEVEEEDNPFPGIYVSNPEGETMEPRAEKSVLKNKSSTPKNQKTNKGDLAFGTLNDSVQNNDKPDSFIPLNKDESLLSNAKDQE